VVEFSQTLRGVHRSGPDWSPGERVLEQYELLEELGTGGQGAVFKARDLDTGLIFALKVVPLDEHSVDEVKNAIGITHPNVCRLHYTKPEGRFRVIVMEFVGGPTLRERLQKGPLPERLAMAVFRGICEGVRAAHERNIHHLDLKPENVLLRDGVDPVVCDFGFASVSGSTARGGTDKYMAPEQQKGERTVKGTDVFALGVMLDELVSQRSKRLDAVIKRARAESLELRPANVAELLRLVDAAQRGRPWFGVPVATAGVALLVGAIGWGYAQLRHPAVEPRADIIAYGAQRAQDEKPSAVAAAESVAPVVPTPPPAPLRANSVAASTGPISSGARVAQARPTANAAPSSLPPGKPVALVPAKETPDTCSPSLLDDCKRECDLDDAASCYNAGKHILNNFKNAPAAAVFFKRACDGNFANGCTDLGFMTESGNGVGKDASRAASLYQRACDLGAAHGCNNLGGLYGNGEGVDQDRQRAAKLFARACDAGDPFGCGNLGLAHNEGLGVVVDKPQAIELLKRACRGDSSWCRNYNDAKGK
jgi:serine/threonine protein kinase